MKTGSALYGPQMPLAKKTSSLKSGTEDRPFLMAPKAAWLSMCTMARRPARNSWKVQTEAQNYAADLEGVDLGGPIREG